MGCGSTGKSGLFNQIRHQSGVYTCLVSDSERISVGVSAFFSVCSQTIAIILGRRTGLGKRDRLFGGKHAPVRTVGAAQLHTRTRRVLYMCTPNWAFLTRADRMRTCSISEARSPQRRSNSPYVATPYVARLLRDVDLPLQVW